MYSAVSGVGFIACLSLSYLFWYGYFLICLVCRSHSASVWISSRDPCVAPCVAEHSVSVGGGELSSLPCHDLGQPLLFGLWGFWKNITKGKHTSHHSTLEIWTQSPYQGYLISQVIIRDINPNVKVVLVRFFTVNLLLFPLILEDVTLTLFRSRQI